MVHENDSESQLVEEKMVRDEKRKIEMWGVLVGLPLWLAFAGIFYFTGIYEELGKFALLKFYGDDPNIVFTLITFPGSIAVMIASMIGATRRATRIRDRLPLKIALAESLDLFLWLNLTSLWMGIIIRYTIWPFYESVLYFGFALTILLALLPPIIGLPFALDFLMPKLWKHIFHHNYGYFQGRLVKNLGRSWKKGDWQTDLRRYLLGGVILVCVVVAVAVILNIMGILK